ncbi:MAG: hypothetical protein ACE5FI_00825 [Anaerolineales bacterium]
MPACSAQVGLAWHERRRYTYTYRPDIPLAIKAGLGEYELDGNW